MGNLQGFKKQAFLLSQAPMSADVPSQRFLAPGLIGIVFRLIAPSGAQDCTEHFRPIASIIIALNRIKENIRSNSSPHQSPIPLHWAPSRRTHFQSTFQSTVNRQKLMRNHTIQRHLLVLVVPCYSIPVPTHVWSPMIYLIRTFYSFWKQPRSALRFALF